MTNWTELKRLADDTEGWQELRDCWPVEEEDCDPSEFAWEIGVLNEGEKYGVINVNTWQYDAPDSAEKIARYYAAANPKTILALIDENERLRTRLEVSDDHPYDGIYCRDATIQGLEQLIEKLWRPIEQDRDELRAEVEALRKDAERYRWLRSNAYGAMSYGALEYLFSYNESIIDEKLDAAMRNKP